MRHKQSGKETVMLRLKTLTQHARIWYSHQLILSEIAKVKTIRLELGSGSNPQPGFIHLDVVPTAPHVDICADISRGIPLPDSCVSEIIANHVIEHISWRDNFHFISELRRVLMPGGKVFLRTPDLDFIVRVYQHGLTTPEYKPDEEFLLKHFGKITPGLWANVKIFSSQDYPSNLHRSIYTFTTLKELLEKYDFREILRPKGMPVFSAGELQIEAVCGKTEDGSPTSSLTFQTRIALGLHACIAWRYKTADLLKNAAINIIFHSVARSADRFWARAKNNMLPKNPQKIIVFNMAGIGDFARMIPFVRHLKRAYPACKITVVTNAGIGDISLFRTYIDDCIPIKPTRDYCTRFDNGHATLAGIFSLKPRAVLKIRKERFDLGIVFGLNEATGNFGTGLLHLGQVSYRIGIHLGDLEQYLNAHNKPQARINDTDFYLLPLSVLCIPVTDKRLEASVSTAAVDWARQYLVMSGYSGQKKPLFVIHPGSAGMTTSRRWPANKFAQIADKAAAELNAAVVFTGGRNECGLIRNIVQMMKTTPISTAGVTNMQGLAALLQMADLVLTNDTSTLHLASAVGAQRIIGIFGPTDPKKVIPYDTNIRVVTSRTTCSPCINKYDGNDPSTACTNKAQEQCLLDISVEDAWQTITESFGKTEQHT